jgi:hypothetical protein
MSSLNGCGQVDDIGRISLFIATPYATANASIPLYGHSPVNNSQSYQTKRHTGTVSVAAP